MASNVSTSALTVNAAFLQEIKEVNLDLWRLLDDLRLKMARPDYLLRHRRQLLAEFEELRDQLALHFALEEAYGYFEDPVFVSPRLCDEAHALRSEHRQLYLLVCQLAEAIQELRAAKNPDLTQAEDLSQEFQEFDRQLREHESAENRLIFREYDEDLGVGD